MSTDTEPAGGGYESSGRHAEPAPRPDADLVAPPAERGLLSIQPRVVEKIAVRAAAEVHTVAGPQQRILGVPLGSDRAAARPRVDVDLDGLVGSARVRLSLAYPEPIRRSADRLRSVIRTQVARYTGVDLPQIDVHITWLGQERSARREPR